MSDHPYEPPQGPMPYAGVMNDPRQAKRFVINGEAINRECRWCRNPLVRTAAGAIVCGGFCDMPDLEDPDYANPALPPTEEPTDG